MPFEHTVLLTGDSQRKLVVVNELAGIQHVPQDIILWWKGDLQKRYPPFRFVYTLDLPTARKKRHYSDWRSVCGFLSDVLGRQSIVLDVSSFDVQITEAFEKARIHLPSSTSSRPGQLKLSTVARLLRKRRREGSSSLQAGMNKRRRS